MDTHAASAIVAEGGFDHLRGIQIALRSQGVASEIVRPPPAQCSS